MTNTPSPDDLFAEYLRHGEPAHFAQLHDLLHDELTRAAERFAPNRSAAEDLVQATFLGALESAGRFLRGRKVVPWLFGILQNQARMARWRARRVPDAQRVVWPEPRDPAELAADRELEQTLARALERLGPVYAPVMQLHLRDEMSAQDIGKALDRPAGTVRTQVVRGTAMLRSLLPAGIASLLLVRVTPGLDRAGMRELLLVHAARGPAAPATATWLSARAFLFAAASVLTVALAWLAFATGSSRSPAATPPVQQQQARADERVPSGPPAARADTNTNAPLERSLVAQAATAEFTVLVTSGGAPVPAMPVQLIGAEDPRFRRFTAMTDAAGKASLRDLPAGRWLVTPLGERAPRTAAIVELKDGERREHGVELGTVLTFEGRAIDERGAPIAGADVWLCDGDYVHSYGFAATRMLTTGADGRFTLATCPRHRMCAVQVIAPGRRASAVHRLPQQRSEQHTFALAPDGDCVQGIVVDTAGAPIAGVLVRAVHAGKRDRTAVVGEDGTTRSSDTIGAVREVATGADGRFRIEGFDRGRAVALKVWGPEWARSEGSIEAGEQPVTLTLQRGATIHGRVVDQAGKPVAEATVATEPEADQDPMTARVRTDADGRYTLAGVTPGDAVVVTVASRTDRRGQGGAGNATATLRLEPGSTLEWNATFAAGNAFRGTLAMSDGSPFDGFTFQLLAVDKVEGVNHFPVKPGKRGEFEVKNVPQARYWLQVDHDNCVLLQFVVSWPLADRYDIVVPAHIARRNIDCFKAAREPQQPATGTVDVLDMKAPGTNLSAYVFAVGGAQPWRWITSGLDWNAERDCRTATLAPGQYELTVFSTQWSRDALATADQVIPFTITANQTTTLRPVLQPGVRRCFRIDEPSPHLGAYGGIAEVHDSNGRLVSRWILPRWLEPAPGTFEASVALAPGRYRIDVETDLGHRGSLDFTVDTLAPCPDVVPLPVR
ncbi:MAG TPA: sigma-70 family RNA polymerase sigma factor [Planctomycetota bacterium]